MSALRPLSALLLVVLAGPVVAQDAPGPVPSDSTATPGDSAAVSLGGLLARLEAPAPPPPPGPISVLRNTLERSSQPTHHVFGSGLRVVLPPAWDGPAAALDHAPGYALYTFENTTPEHPLLGAALRVERVQGLNALLRERWMRGQTPHGYHGTRAVGPASAPMGGFAVEVEGAGGAGIVVFSQRDGTMWATQVWAPRPLWYARRGELVALLAGVTLP